MHRLCGLLAALAAIGAQTAGAAQSEQTAAALGYREALTRAEADSPTIAAARASVAAAEGRARQAGLRLNPEARLQVENIGGTGSVSGVSGAETTLSLAQTFEMGGQRRARMVAAEAEIAVARLELLVAVADARRDVRVAFIDAWEAQEKVRLAREALGRAEELARVATILVNEGRDPPLRALRARTAAAEARASLASAEAAYATALIVFSTAYGSSEAPALVDDPSEADVTIIPPPADPAQRLDVRLADAKAAAAWASLGRERTVARRTVTAEAGVRHFAETGDVGLVFGLATPLIIRDRNQGNVAAATAEAEAAQARRNAALITAARQERDATSALAAADSQLAALRGSALVEAQEALRVATIGYQAGRFNLVELLDAQTALTNAERQLIEAQAARLRAQAALARARATGEDA